MPLSQLAACACAALRKRTPSTRRAGDADRRGADSGALRSSRRESGFSGARSAQAVDTLLSSKCTAGEAGDEPVEEQVVEQRQRDGRDQHRGRDRSPLDEIAADQIGRHTGRDRAVLRARDERDGVDELVDAEREREDDDGEDARQRRSGRTIRRSAAKREQPSIIAASSSSRGIVLKNPIMQPRRERNREGRVDDDQRPERILEPELGDHARERQEEQRRRDEVGEEDRDAERAAARGPTGGRARSPPAARARA